MKHFPVRTECSGSKVLYVAPCGYASEKSAEFASVSNPSTERVTCEKCLEKMKVRR